MGGNTKSPWHSPGPLNNGGQNQKWPRHPYLLRGPRGPQRATLQNCYITPAFTGVPCKGDNIKTGCIGGKNKTLDMQSKRTPPKKNFADLVCLGGKTNFKARLDHFEKMGDFSKTPRAVGFLGPPPLLVPPVLLSLQPLPLLGSHLGGGGGVRILLDSESRRHCPPLLHPQKGRGAPPL